MPRMINNDAKNDSRRAISAAVSANVDEYHDRKNELDSMNSMIPRMMNNFARTISRMIQKEQF